MENQYKVVIIDDEESMRDSCRQILEKDGFHAETAENGLIGLNKIKEIDPEIVLIDLKMPGISGLEVLDHVRKINPNTIPIVITGYATVGSAVEAMKMGAYDFLPKPFTPEELRLIIKRGLGRLKLIRETESLRREKKLMEENFITMVSHQLRSPLVAIAQYFEVILGGMAGKVLPQQKDMLKKSQDRLEGLLELINDWLDIARTNGGTIIEKRQPVSLREIIMPLIEFLQPVAQKSKISLNLAPVKGSDMALGDAETLEQVFSNLISNAIKYNQPDGSVEISIKETKDHIATEIKDTGIGISEEHLPFIFDQFYRVSRSESRKTKGSGLGLTIAKKIIDAHGGSIQVASQPGEGSTFTVLLPKASGT